MYSMQMWGFTMVHELPYDNPERAPRPPPRPLPDRPRPGDRPRPAAERAPAARPRPAAAGEEAEPFLTWVHWLWFLEPYVSLAYILWRHPQHFPRAARRVAAVFDIGCAAYFAVPTAPPWWASEQGQTGEEVRRIMIDVGEETWKSAWPAMYGALGGNPWAAMPSLHFATSATVAIGLAETGRVAGALGWAYSLTLGFALVYLGEHYVTDLAAGAALVAVVKRGEPFAEPLVLGVNRGLLRLERLANG